MYKFLIRFISTILFLASLQNLQAARRSSFRIAKISKPYTKKSAYVGFGKISKVNGQIKTKAIKGYFKPSSGYKFVNPYARSK